MLDAEAEFYTSSEYPCIDTFPCFEISLQYPETYDTEESFPWQQINFKTHPAKYMDSVLNFAAEGNLSNDWDLKKNTVRNWYHSPWMHKGSRGREPVRGLTRERGSRWHELSPNQTRRTNNWAVGFYNQPGGYTFGQVWKNKSVPNTSDVKFPEGTVSVKLLFTDATDVEAPFLSGNGLTWNAQIVRNSDPTPLRLLQVDIAVRDKRSDDLTGWLFGTFMFNGSVGSENYWENLVPVGLQWGNDPALTRAKYDQGSRAKEGWVNPAVARMFKSHRPPFGDLGYLGRMNGPVDNPFSSCLGCHGRAVDTAGGRGPAFTPRLDDLCVKQVTINQNSTYEKIDGCSVTEEAEERIAFFFRNLKPGEPFLKGSVSLDYSLQMADGVAHWNTWFNQNYPNQFEAAFPVIDPLFHTRNAAVNTDYGIKMQSIEFRKLQEQELIQIPTLPLDQAFGRGDEDL